ncbi:carbohydrate ABC transporter membrane protein 1, CUT1 family [Thalassovita litoralis]|uniref:Carbohydrate ABC transporter membrane protein 1, CUT1 family n=1 Tax=Thalassovita litoralis TaxID=1010611 RepID=A0A521FMW5_9RHOB|nr:sugar ABC transporter permease [Thalassovita litoralis]SMO97528.1 carbohydrate ABC transporter membrane protein 1, CUT1 family [Thalassovita litoralis]
MSDISLSPAAAPRAWPRLGRMYRALRPYLYLFPALACFIIWIYEPLGRAFLLSFQQWNLLPTSPKIWVGLDNYRNIFDLPKFWQALGNTGWYLVGLLPLTVALPLAIAIFTQDLPARSRNLYRALIFVPMIVPPVVGAAVWRWLLDMNHGIINLGLQSLGMEPVGFLSDPDLALWTITFITGWKLIGFAMLILSAANAAIDGSLIEAARLDGASRWQVVRDIRLPLLSPTILLLVLMVVLLGAQWSFAYIHVLTEGGPLGSTSNIYYLLWQFGFGSLSVGWSSASAVILFVGFGLMAMALFALKARFTFHDD